MMDAHTLLFPNPRHFYAAEPERKRYFDRRTASHILPQSENVFQYMVKTRHSASRIRRLKETADILIFI